MSYELFIATRHLKSKRKTGFISLVNYISIAGVMLGVAALIVVLSLMNGFESEIRSRIIGFRAHLELRKTSRAGLADYRDVARQISQFDHVVGVSPYIEEKALILAGKRKSGLSVKGVDPETVALVSDIEKDVGYGTFELGPIKTEGQKAVPGIVLGRYLADKLGVGLEDKVHILSPTSISPILTNIPKFKTFQVAGFFETGIFEFDDMAAYVSIEEAQRLFEMNGTVSGLEIKLDDLNRTDEVAASIGEQLGGPYETVTWFEMNKNLFVSMQLEKWFALIVLSLIIVVAAFNIVSSLIMIVLEKTKEIGILKSMGASSSGIMKIFMLEGLIGGVIGILLGCLLGYTLCWLQLKYQFVSLPPESFVISAIPILMKKMDFFLIASVALLLCFIATVYPANRAAKLSPIDSIRYQ